MRKIIIRALIFVITFVTSVIIISGMQSFGNTDMTQEMSTASLPVIYARVDGHRINPMHGYTGSQNLCYQRDSITTIDESRKGEFEIERFGLNIKSIQMEVRSVDGIRLIENSTIEDYSVTDDSIFFSLQLKDLIDENKEYNLSLILTLENDTQAYYYTRVVQAKDYHTSEKLAFVEDFTQATFDKESVQGLARYMEPYSKKGEMQYGKIDIHSSLDDLSYGNLGARQYTQPIYTVSELSAQTASMISSFLVSIREENDIRYFQVKEFFRIRYTVDRIYLLDYQRTMSEILDETNREVYRDGVVELGIQPELPVLVESESGNVFTFENNGRLFSFNESEGKMSELFAFYSEKALDERTLNDAHSIKVLSVDETGNVAFAVYGYMNRGLHEGRVGIGIYLFNSMTNTTDERAFIPYEKSPRILETEMEQLSYLSKTDIFYCILDGNIYGVHLSDQSVEVLAEHIGEDGFRISQDQSSLVWQNGVDEYHSSSLTLMNLNTQVSSEIRGEVLQYVKPIGFMGTDLVYGIANREDVYTDSTGIVTFGMCRLRIQDENGTLLKEYEEEGVYITDAQIVDNQLLLTRAKKSSDNKTYVPISSDQIISSTMVQESMNKAGERDDPISGKCAEIYLKKEVAGNHIQVLNPKFTIFEGYREAALSKGDEGEHYYVYSGGKVSLVTEKPSKAVSFANNESGVVLNEHGEYVWIKGNRSTRNQIMAIKHTPASEDRSALAVCIDTMLLYENVIRNSQYLLDQNETVLSILEENLENATVLDLTGCNLDSVLYYVNRDIPVLVLVKEEAYLVIGFNESQIVLMDPEADGLYKKNTMDMSDYFSSNGAVFITYLPHE